MALRFQGFDVECAGNGRDALAAVRSFDPHLMVLDIMLPDIEGFEVAKRLGAQRANLPIIFLTARDATQDKIRGLTTGGDDYVTKPFSLEELVARIRAILRRSGVGEASSSRLTFEDLELDEDTREVSRAGAPIELTTTEYRLLRYLLLNPRRVLTRAQLLDHVWEYDFDGDSRDGAGRHVPRRARGRDTGWGAGACGATAAARRAPHDQLRRQPLPRARRGDAVSARPDDGDRRALHRGRRDAEPAAADRGCCDRGGAGAGGRVDRAARAAPAGSDRRDGGRDRRRRPVAPRGARGVAHGGRTAGPRAERDARPAGGRVRRAARERGAPASLPGGRLARAAHPTGVDPRLRRAVSDRSRARGCRDGEGDEPHRGRVGAHGRARGGPARASC